MEKFNPIGYNPEERFDFFLSQLREKRPGEWRWLLDMLRKRVTPWLFKKDGNLPAGAIASVDEFIEEVFANSLYQFCELFETGTFANLGEIRGLMFRIGELKLKEGYHKVRRDGLIYFKDDIRNNEDLTAQQDKLTLLDLRTQDAILELREQIVKLEKEDQEILIRYSKGEELSSIAINLGITAAACRKKKQRALEKLREFVLDGFGK